MSKVSLLLHFQLRHGVCCIALIPGLSLDVWHGGNMTRRRNGPDMSWGGSYHPSGSPVALHAL